MKDWEKKLENRRAASRRRAGGHVSKRQRKVEGFNVQQAKANMRTLMQAVETAEKPLINVKADLKEYASGKDGAPELFIVRARKALQSLGKAEVALSLLYDDIAMLENVISRMR